MMIRQFIITFTVILTVLVLLVGGIGAAYKSTRFGSSRPNHRLLLWDNSVSRGYLGDAHPAVEPTLADIAREWTASAAEGSLLELWKFTTRGSAVEIERPFELKKPKPEYPIALWREALSKEVAQSLTALTLEEKRAPGMTWSPILEGAWRLMERGGSLEGDYHLVLLGTDLLQTSNQFTFTRDYLSGRTDEDILEAVREELPAPSHPPVAVTIYFYPGAPGPETPMTGAYTRRLQILFGRIFKEVWAIPRVDFQELR